jgi:hypothetical protein
MSKNTLSSVHIGMSIVNLRSNTLQNLKKLYEWAAACDFITVTIFNKTGSTIDSFGDSKNLSVVILENEDLYTTMSRLDLSQSTHIWWVNDDDYFGAQDLSRLANLQPETLYLPNMEIISDFKRGKIDWTNLMAQSQPEDFYLAYWKIGAPLIFAVLPVSVFNRWVHFVRRDPFHLPHLDTQLNLLAALVDRKEILEGFDYHYGTENWQDVRSVNESARKHALGQSMDPNYVYTMNIVRNIENICIVVSNYKDSKAKIPYKLMLTLLNQFGPFQNGRRAYIYKKFYPISIRAKIILQNIDDEAKGYLMNFPRRTRALLLGAVNFSHHNQILEYFDEATVFESLLVPDTKRDFWRAELEK